MVHQKQEKHKCSIYFVEYKSWKDKAIFTWFLSNRFWLVESRNLSALIGFSRQKTQLQLCWSFNLSSRSSLKKSWKSTGASKSSVKSSLLSTFEVYFPCYTTSLGRAAFDLIFPPDVIVWCSWGRVTKLWKSGWETWTMTRSHILTCKF